MAPGSVGHDVRQLCEPLLAPHGLVIESVDVTGSAGRRVVSFVIDLDEHDEGQLDLDRIGVASQLISDAIDASSFADDVASLEVSSPGAERELTLWRHAVHAVGRMLVLRTVAGVELRGRLEGIDAEAQAIVVVPETAGLKGRKPKIGAPQTIAWSDVATARVEVELRGSDDDLPDVVDEDEDDGDDEPWDEHDHGADEPTHEED